MFCAVLIVIVSAPGTKNLIDMLYTPVPSGWEHRAQDLEIFRLSIEIGCFVSEQLAEQKKHFGLKAY